MADEELLSTAFEVLNTLMHFIEHGDVTGLIDDEIKNFFMMCQQVEIFQEKFLQKGYVLAHDSEKGAFLTSMALNKMDYDLGLLADRLLEKFCHQQHAGNSVMGTAVREFIDRYGALRFTRFLEVTSSSKGAFNLTTLIGRAYENGYNLEGAVFMECLERVALSPRGMSRTKDIINEFLVEDVCAETIVSMLAVQHAAADKLTEIKHAIFEKLEAKFSAKPKGRIWLLMVRAPHLVDAANNFPPIVNFVLKVISSLSESITYDPSRDHYYSPPDCLTYKNLVRIMAKFYRNPKTTQDIVNFVFNQFKADPSVWGSVLTACHNHPEEVSDSDNFYEALYNKAFTDPNTSRESLQLMLKSIVNRDHLQMAVALGWKPSKSVVFLNSDVQQPPDSEPFAPHNFSGNAAAKELAVSSSLGPENIHIESKPSNVKLERPGHDIVPCCQFFGLVPVRAEARIVTALVSGPVEVASLPRTSSNRTVVDRRPLSSRVKRYPQRMDDFWAW